MKKSDIKMTLKMAAGLNDYKSDIYASRGFVLNCFDRHFEGRPEMTITEQEAFLGYLFAACVQHLDSGMYGCVKTAMDAYIDNEFSYKAQQAREIARNKALYGGKKPPARRK